MNIPVYATFCLSTAAWCFGRGDASGTAVILTIWSAIWLAKWGIESGRKQGKPYDWEREQ